MNPVGTALTAGALVVTGKWARGKTPSVDNAIGVAGIALGLSILEQFDDRLSSAFAALILVSLAAVHLPVIVKAVGFGGSSSEPLGRAGSALGLGE